MADKNNAPVRKNFLNEEIKKREAEEAKRKGERSGNEPMKLDDTSRVKVLSPGRMVAKRFFRNKLAMVGLCILVFMFIFAFLCPLIYPYGQTDIFYKYEYLNINYAAAKERTEYSNFVLDPDADIHYSVKNRMTSYINEMESKKLDRLDVTDDSGVSYVVERLGDGIYSLNASEAEEVAAFETEKRVCEYNRIQKTTAAVSGTLPQGFAEAAAAAVEAGKMSFELDGVTYTMTEGSKKMLLNVSREGRGLVIFDSALGDDFAAAYEKADAAGDSAFTFNGEHYSIKNGADDVSICRMGDTAPAMISSLYVFDAYEPGAKYSDEFKAEALQAVYGGGGFSYDGSDYTVRRDEDSFFVYDKSGTEVAMLSTFVVRRYSGEDTCSLEFKAKTAEVIEEMEDAGKTEGSFTFMLQEMDENGILIYDENGQPTYHEREITVTRAVDQYVLKCEQITNLIDIYAPPSSAHWFGTDADGMDILARMMYGGRVSLMVSFVVVIIECLLGVIMGGVAGFFGGWVDTLIMRLVDIFYCIPTYPILIIMGAYFDAVKMSSYTRLVFMMAILGILGWAGVARLVRGQILSLREQEFMVAAEATGIKAGRRIFKHLVPNVMPQLIVSATMGLGSVIILESTLSFLGLGVKRPLATWGTMINAITSSNENLVRYAHIWIPIGLLICLTVIAFNFVGDGLRDAFDPKMKQ